MVKLLISFVFLVVLDLLGCATASEEHVVVLKDGHLTVDGEMGKQFTIDATVGDVLHIFHSDPDFSHEFYVSDEHYSMEEGNLVALGDHHDMLLDHPSTFEILCYHMDDMKITVAVTE